MGLWATRAQWLVGFIGVRQIDVGDRLLAEKNLEAPVGGCWSQPDGLFTQGFADSELFATYAPITRCCSTRTSATSERFPAMADRKSVV